MIKRPINPRFNEAILSGCKLTTIRDSFWRTDVPIMLYNWSAAAYRSKQIDVAPIIVESVQPLEIVMPDFGEPSYYPRIIDGRPLWSCEGFKDQDDMDSWFYKVVKTGQTANKFLMRFRLLNVLAHPRRDKSPNSTLRLIAVGWSVVFA
jgi:hypothetical protein